MNVVSKVGSIITQGVYSVATPFHPFGGAVDIIVVKQEDGTYRSTPWYVRFGKFQGVLKVAEKIVHISVNGIEADFHMYLDNSGEAYFVKEEPEDRDRESEEQVSDSPDKSSKNQENDELYELEGNAISSSEYSYRYESINEVDELVDSSEDLNSEMVLFSVDGHVLTAPISSSEETVENVQLTVPQFHLGPGEGSGEGFASGGDEWGASLFRNMDLPSSDITHDLKKETTEHENGDATFSGYQESAEISLDAAICDSGGFASYDGKIQIEDNVDGSLSSALEKPVDCDDVKILTESVAINMHIESHEEKVTIKNSESNSESVSLSMQSLDMNVDVKYEPMGSIQEQTIIRESSGFELSLCGNLLRSGMGWKAADEAFKANLISREEFESSGQSITKNRNLIVRYKGKYLPWDAAAPIVLGKVAFGLDMPIDCKNCIFIEEEVPSESSPGSLLRSPSSRRWRLWPIPFRRVKTLQHSESNASSEDVFLDSDSFLQSPRSDSFASPRVNGGQSPGKRFVRTNIPTTEQIASLNLKDGQNTIAFSFSTRVLGRQQVDAHVYLWKWNARIVISDVDGTITKHGLRQCDMILDREYNAEEIARIKPKQNPNYHKLGVRGTDGPLEESNPVNKWSDVLGQFMPLVGRDWTQSGVARLFSAIKENGYQLLFLSARAIVQAYLTRSFLLNLKQDGKTLPNGPVVISPDGLFPSLYREVIRRAPHEFKIACLEDIRALFPSDYNPFYAGFGNRDTDELSYRKIGIPKGKVFIINPKGEVAVNHFIDVKSYTSLHTLVNDMFPPTAVVEQEDFNSWNYWKMPLPSIDC